MQLFRPLLSKAESAGFHGPSLLAYFALMLPPWLLWHQLNDPGADSWWLAALLSLLSCWGAFRLLPRLQYPQGGLRGTLMGWSLLLSVGWVYWRILQGSYLFEWYPSDSPVIEDYFAGNPLTFIYNKAHIKAAFGELFAAAACWASVLFLGSALWRLKAPLKLDPRIPLLLFLLLIINLYPNSLTPDLPHWSEFLATGWGVMNGRVTYLNNTSFYGLLMPLIPTLWINLLGLSQLSLLSYTLLLHLFSFWAVYKLGAQVSKSPNLAFIGALALQVWATNGLAFAATVPSNSLLRGCLPTILVLWGIWGMLAGRRRKLAAFFCGVVLLWELSLAAFGTIAVLLALGLTWRRGGRPGLLLLIATPALATYIWTWAFHGPVFSPLEVLSYNLEVLAAMSKGWAASPQRVLWYHPWALAFAFFALWRLFRPGASASNRAALLAASLPLVSYWFIYSLGRTAANQNYGLIWAMAPAALAYLGLFYRMRQGRPWVTVLGVAVLLLLQLPNKLSEPINHLLTPISGAEYNWARACQEGYIMRQEPCSSEPPQMLGQKFVNLASLPPQWQAAYELPRYPYLARACREKIPFLSMLDSLVFLKEDCMFLSEIPNPYMLVAKGQMERFRKDLSNYPVILYDDHSQGLTSSELGIQRLQREMLKHGYLRIATDVPRLRLWFDPTKNWESVIDRLAFKDPERLKTNMRMLIPLAQEVR